eukprot:TRINITY_DN1175_c0_g1_i2.p1 TRINITY_DN1175_c0_g1~~TRINITY_DN1175_c0_g1_i2.p1  ORF type:complete len:145 (-),score=29.32 TRINITY_DN1175_c0_g1_i2:312-746(-)
MLCSACCWLCEFIVFFFFSSRRRHTRCREVSWARRCVQETGINAEYMGMQTSQSSNMNTLKPASLIFYSGLQPREKARMLNKLSLASTKEASQKVAKSTGTKPHRKMIANSHSIPYLETSLFQGLFLGLLLGYCRKAARVQCGL